RGWQTGSCEAIAAYVKRMRIQAALRLIPMISSGNEIGTTLPTQTLKYSSDTPIMEIRSRLKFLRISTPMAIAIGITTHDGITAVSNSIISAAIMDPNTALTINSNRKMTIMNSVWVRLPMTLSESAPIDRPL